MWARPCGPRLWSVANAPGATLSPPRRPPRGLGHAALDSDHAECHGHMASVLGRNVVFSYEQFYLSVHTRTHIFAQFSTGKWTTLQMRLSISRLIELDGRRAAGF